MTGIDPILMFLEAVERAREREVDTAPVALATTSANGRPSVRMVLLRGADHNGFVFYTNYESRKALEVEATRWAALCFHWVAIEEQIRVEGRVSRLSHAESDEYFATRPRGSQLAAWASRQSETMASRAELEERYREVADRFAGQPVPRPPFWGGYRLVPEHVEFWLGRPDRLHDRLVYVREGETWRVSRLYP